MKKKLTKLMPVILAATMIMSAAPPAYADTGHGIPHNWVADKTEKIKVSETREYKDVKYLDTTPMINENDPKWSDPQRYGYENVKDTWADGKPGGPGDTDYGNTHLPDGVTRTYLDGWTPLSAVWIDDITTKKAFQIEDATSAVEYFNNGHQDDQWEENFVYVTVISGQRGKYKFAYDYHTSDDTSSCDDSVADEYLGNPVKTKKDWVVTPVYKEKVTQYRCYECDSIADANKNIISYGRWYKDSQCELYDEYIKNGGKEENTDDNKDTNNKNSTTPTDPTAVAETGFQDVASTAWYYDAVKWIKNARITSGTSATTYSPDQPCTRAQMVTFLWRCVGSPDIDGSSLNFKDVSSNHFSKKAIAWAYANGITSGTSDTTFSPDQPCTRAQMATFLWRFYVSKAADNKYYTSNSTGSLGDLKSEYKTGFSDIPANYWASNGVYAMKLFGITSGTTPTTYSPDAPCTRAQMATFLYRLDQMAQKEFSESIIDKT